MDSVIWYSREITRRLGAVRFQRGIHRLAYGNGDLSGDPGQNNGLTHAWLSSSLQISPLGQVAFLGALVGERLPVRRDAMAKTRAIVPVFATANGWTIHGKTGTGFQPRPGGGVDRDRQFGWFVGWGEKDGRKLVFARLIKDTGPEAVRAGFRARDALLADWPDLVKGH